jgi:hypothetical protein
MLNFGYTFGLDVFYTFSTLFTTLFTTLWYTFGTLWIHILIHFWTPLGTLFIHTFYMISNTLFWYTVSYTFVHFD